MPLLENTPILITPRLLLRPFTEADAGDLLLLLSDLGVNTFLPWFPVETLEQAREHLEREFLRYYERPSAYRYAITLKSDRQVIGYINLSGGDAHDLGYALMKDYWHRGIATEAGIALVQRLGAAGYEYITATHDVNNPASGAVMKKLGMSYRYSYVEQWQPKDILVTFRMYQLNLGDIEAEVYRGYWDRYPEHFVETDI